LPNASSHNRSSLPTFWPSLLLGAGGKTYAAAV
jgi:hypothetical protein